MKKYKAYLLLWLSAIAVSCSLDYPPESEVSDPDAIVSVASAEQALAAAYASYKPYGDAVMWAGRADDLLPSEYLSRDNSLYNTYMWDERELITQSENLWKSLYETVVKCNVLIERLPKVPANTRDDREQLQRIHQRASYLKALCYFDLLRISLQLLAVMNQLLMACLSKITSPLPSSKNGLPRASQWKR